MANICDFHNICKSELHQVDDRSLRHNSTSNFDPAQNFYTTSTLWYHMLNGNKAAMLVIFKIIQCLLLG